ncbi:hypothetical protein IMZ48_24760 [Candidatus Bathyarchaeota archaeon]|nr:hypothetical protein [Candidatus Bathyarchaeota archaeon]
MSKLYYVFPRASSADLGARRPASGIAASPEFIPPSTRQPQHRQPPTPHPPRQSNGTMSQKEDRQPVVLKAPSALRSIIAGSTAGAVEIGESELQSWRFLDLGWAC